MEEVEEVVTIESEALPSSSWTAEDILKLFDILKELHEISYYMLGAVFGLLAMLLLLIFFITFKK